MKKKKLFYLATVFVALTSCSSEDYVGDKSLKEANEHTPITFGFDVPTPTRASGAEAATALGNSFAVYGTKTVSSTTSNVFALNEYSTETNTPYWVWYTASTAGKTTSNTNNWEYVGAANTHATGIPASDQTIKFWDYSASQYDFVAYKATVGTPTISNLTNSGFTVSATTDQLAGLYIADKVVLTKKDNSPAANPNTTVAAKIGDVVQFTFRAAGAKVRLGIYETIPGYAISAVTFHYNSTKSTTNAGLDGSFVGSSEAKSFTVTYGTDKRAIVAAPNDANTTYRDFGTFTVSTSALMGTSSTAPTWAGGSEAYASVMPNTTNVGAMTLSVDYTLYNTVTHETINVTGAKAVVPLNYMTWKANTAYTYLFKISDNTNGSTGIVGTNPAGLYPVTFDAVTIASDENAEGSITTVSTPAITTYQAGSVSAAGITYAKSAQPIYVTVNTDGTLATLTTDNTKLYTVATGTTEAALQLEAVTKTAATLTVVAENITVGSTSFVANKAVTFTPSAAGTYAIEYTDDSSVKHYKVIVVQ